MDRLLQSWVTQQAEVRAWDAAIISGTDRLTYSQLEVASNQLAHLLQTAGCQNGDRVCILMPKSAEAIISMIGILRAGCMPGPIDVATPAARIRHIFDSCENRVIVAGGRVVPLLEELMADEALRSRSTIIWLENLGVATDTSAPEAKNFKATFSIRDLKAAPSVPLPQNRLASDGSHILFTSGSTGVPKGVVITHSNVSAFVGWALKHYGIDHTDRFSGHTPFHFDLSTFDIFGSITAGAQLHLVPSETALLPPKLAEFIRNSKLTQWFSVPSVLNYMAKFNSVQQNDFPDLRVLNEKFQPGPVREIGDLFISGAGLSPGYWRDPTKTAAAFLQDKNDPTRRLYRTGDLAYRDEQGLVWFVGRADTQ